MKHFPLPQLQRPRRPRPTYPASLYGLRSDGALVTYTRYINRRHNTNYIPPKPKLWAVSFISSPTSCSH